ncbi:MAG: carbamoyltransferase N-terminal domain-containing protein, partial [Nitrospinota bacterium]|nr:carbamoyltransferase N-terminal domain-containing protein [Nitrospinota bacterium]
MYILGIHDGHNCGATLTRGAEVIASISEERLTRRKNDVGYPRNAIDEVLRIGGVNPDQLADVIIASLFMHKEEYLRCVENWYRVGRKEQEEEMRKPTEYMKVVFDHRSRERIETVTSHLGVGSDCVEFLEHHLAHLAAAYYMAPSSVDGKPVLGLTCDGSGDGVSATVSVCEGDKIERISTTQRDASLGKIYSRVTYLLGMKPWEDEHKVMGLAAYVDPERCTGAVKVLESLLKVEDGSLDLSQTTSLTTHYCYEYLREAFEHVRFDIIAGAMQIFTERILEKWVKNCIQETGLADVVCGGGVFMNVKANMIISEIPNLKSLYVVPSGGDESLSLGACLYKYHQMRGDTRPNQGVPV